MTHRSQSADSTRFFMTHHGPVGAWCSLTFGLPGRGASIDIQRTAVDDSTNLYAGVCRGKGRVEVLPFFQGAAFDAELQAATGPGNRLAHWRPVPAREIARRLTPCVDEFRTAHFTLRAYSPLPALPDPESGSSLADAVCPAILLELEVDNTASQEPCSGLLALEPKAGPGKPAPVDWMTDGRLSGLTCRGRWALAALPEPGRVFTVRGDLDRVEDGTALVHDVGSKGGVMIAVPAGERRTLTCAFGFYHHGPGSHGIAGRYWYAQHYADVFAVCSAALERADAIREECRLFDREAERRCPDRLRRELFAQSVRGYSGNTQLLADPDGRPLYSVCEGQFKWRNTLDLAADHLPWELWHNPWVTRNIMDLLIDRYSYRDELRFPGESGVHAGGLAFTHDMGADDTYSPAGQSGYETPDVQGCYSFMTTEQVLNGSYAIVAYILASGDRAWAEKRRGTLADLVESLERRDHWDPARRTGLPKAESTKVGTRGHEITTYDCLDESLKSARGNLYIAVKAWCAAVMLAEVLDRVGDSRTAAGAREMAGRAAATLAGLFDARRKCFPSNLMDPGEGLMIAAIEPLAVPMFVDLADRLREFGELVRLLGEHVRSCLVPGACLDAATGGLRLSSGSHNTWPSKGFLCAYVMEQFFGIDLQADCPTVMREFVCWMQVAAAGQTLTDQIYSDVRKATSGAYYPRMATSSLWLAPRCTAT